MPSRFTTIWWRAMLVAAGLLILKVTVAVMLGYVDYFPPNFDSDFLRGRERYFFGLYRWAFYPHIAAGPVAIVLGLVLTSDRFRGRYPKWHRNLGRFHTANVLFVVAPSGLWMAYYAASGVTAAVGFAVLAVLTGTCTACGWRAAVQRRFPVHRRWMWRSFLLLCSAVVLRLLGGLGTVAGVESDWFDPVASWASWLAPLAIFEISRFKNRRPSPRSK